MDTAQEVNSFQMVELFWEQSQMSPQHWEGSKCLISPFQKAGAPKIMIKRSIPLQSACGKDTKLNNLDHLKNCSVSPQYVFQMMGKKFVKWTSWEAPHDAKFELHNRVQSI